MGNHLNKYLKIGLYHRTRTTRSDHQPHRKITDANVTHNHSCRLILTTCPIIWTCFLSLLKEKGTNLVLHKRSFHVFMMNVDLFITRIEPTALFNPHYHVVTRYPISSQIPVETWHTTTRVRMTFQTTMLYPFTSSRSLTHRLFYSIPYLLVARQLKNQINTPRTFMSEMTL